MKKYYSVNHGPKTLLAHTASLISDNVAILAGLDYELFFIETPLISGNQLRMAIMSRMHALYPGIPEDTSPFRSYQSRSGPANLDVQPFH